MDSGRGILQVLPRDPLRPRFPSGREAPAGGEVVWDDGTRCVRVAINELLDSMQMD